MELLLSASIIAAFIAGVAALFAPCCITVLLPSYFASIFREKRKVFLMTFIFFLGILAVFLPIGLGAATLGKFFSQYHNIIFGIGGTFLAILGIILLTGIHFSLPMRASPALKNQNAVSVFVLGVFSNPYLWLAVLASVLLQVMVVQWAAVQPIFETVSLNLFEWSLIVAVSSSILLVLEFLKYAKKRE